MTRWLRGLYGEPWLFWLLTTHMLGQGGFYLVRPLASYRALELDVAPASLGLLAAAFSLAPLVVALWIGRLVDRRGALLFVVLGNGLMVISAFAMAVAGDVLTLFVLAAGVGLGHLLAVVAAQGMVAAGSDEDSYDRRFSAFSFAGSIGQFMGPALLAVIASQGSSEATTRALLVGGAILAATLPVAALIRPVAGRAATGRHGAGSQSTSLLSILRTPGVLRAILVSTTVLSTVDIMIAYLPALGEERLWTASLVGLLLAIRAAASMGMRLVLGALATRYGRGRLLAGSMAVSAASLVLLPIDLPVPVIAILMITAGAGLGIGQPLTMAWVASLSSPETRATTLSVRIMGNRVGQVTLPVIVGSIAALSGAGGVLGATGLIVAISLVGAYGGLDRRTPAQRRAEERGAAEQRAAAQPAPAADDQGSAR